MPAFSSAVLAMSLSAIAFAVMAVLARMASSAVPSSEVALVRFCCGLIACTVAHLRAPLVPRNRLGLLLRGTLGGLSVLIYFATLQRFRSAWPRCCSTPPRPSPPSGPRSCSASG